MGMTQRESDLEWLPSTLQVSRKGSLCCSLAVEKFIPSIDVTHIPFHVRALLKVEESTVNERTFRLLPQDRFIRDNISEEDVLIVSVGGNDVVWAPCPCTIISFLVLLALPSWCIRNSCSLGTVPVSD